jgi:mono/diheme cytochrome c family protein
MFDTVGMLILVILLAAFVWLFTRALKARSAVLKWIGAIFSGLFSLVFVVGVIAALVGFYKLNYPPYQYVVSNIKVAGTPEQVARGQKMAYVCAGCHSTKDDLPLDGSAEDFLAGSPLGSLTPPNLTPAGPIKDWSDGEIIRAIREGVDKNGHPLIIMPSQPLHNLSDDDVQAIVAYLRSQPPVQHYVPSPKISVIGAIFFGLGMAPPTSAQPPITQPVIAPAPGTLDHGKYLVDSYGCRDCHGSDLSGGTDPTGGNGPNLTVLVPKWEESGFTNTFRTGVDPSGHKLSDAMPWKDYSKAFDDAQLKDVYSYLHSLTPIIKTANK